MQKLADVLISNDRVYHIPEFQRDFVWGKEEAEELFNDFSEDTESFSKKNDDLQGYLLGNIVLIENKNHYLVIDGQQRLTTITLLFKALYQTISSKISNTENEDRDKWLKKISNIDNAYQINDDEDAFEGLRITHDEGLTFGKYYRDLIRDNITLDDKLTKTSDQKISEVFDTLTEKINDLEDDQLNKFILYIKNKVKLIITIAPSEGKAFQLFEVLNDRGRSLEPMDLVKNMFLKQLRIDGFNDEDTKRFNENWSSFIENLILTKKTKIASSTFMKHFITSYYGKNIKQDKLFDFFKEKETMNGSSILELSKNLERNSRIYSSIEKSPLNNDYIKEDINLYIIFKLLRIKQLHPLLMMFYNSTEEIKRKVNNICVKYGATIIFSSTQTNTIEKELPTIIETLMKVNDDDKKIEKLEELISKQISNYQEQLFNSVSTKTFANSAGKPLSKAIQILKFIELYYNSNNLIIYSKKNISLEHILARKTQIGAYEDFGFVDREEFDKYINRLGNLTILYSDENTSAGIQSVSEKKNIYQNSDFILTKSMVENLETGIKNGKETKRLDKINNYEPTYELSKLWTKDMIEKRGENLAELIIDSVKI